MWSLLYKGGEGLQSDVYLANHLTIPAKHGKGTSSRVFNLSSIQVPEAQRHRKTPAKEPLAWLIGVHYTF